MSFRAVVSLGLVSCAMTSLAPVLTRRLSFAIASTSESHAARRCLFMGDGSGWLWTRVVVRPSLVGEWEVYSKVGTMKMFPRADDAAVIAAACSKVTIFSFSDEDVDALRRRVLLAMGRIRQKGGEGWVGERALCIKVNRDRSNSTNRKGNAQASCQGGGSRSAARLRIQYYCQCQ